MTTLANTVASRPAGGIKAMRERLGYKIAVWKRLSGFEPRECSACGFVGKFDAYGHPPRYDALCPNCHSLERHRLLALMFKAEPGLLRKTDLVLHFAPEAIVRPMVEPQVARYDGCDIRPGRADLTINIEAIDLPDASYDVAICNHVLEHVDDLKAMPELNRILKPGGRLIAMVPLVEGWDRTYEDDSLRGDHAQDLHFGQYDHIRYYGRDFRDRLAAAGFHVREFGSDGAQTTRYGLSRGERVFIGE